jgi:hypothetical protein
MVGKTVDEMHDGIVVSKDACVYDGQNMVRQFHKDRRMLLFA